MSKKWMGRLLMGIGILIASLLLAAPVAAMWDWCEVDPVLNIGIHKIALEASYLGDPGQIIGQTVFTVYVPTGTDVSVISIEKRAKIDVVYLGAPVAGDISVSVNVECKTKNKANYDSKLMVSIDGGSPTLVAEGSTGTGLYGTFQITDS